MNNELSQLIRQPEGLKLDFKRELYKINHSDGKVRSKHWDEFIKDILALVNGNVGVADQPAFLIIGVGDELRADGTRDLYDIGNIRVTHQEILDKVNSACYPPLPDIRCSTVEIAGNRILIVSVPSTPHLHETTRRLVTSGGPVYPESTVFVRRGEAIYPASEAERHAILSEKQSLLSKQNVQDRYSIEQLSLTSDLIERHRKYLALTPRYARWADKSADESYIHSTGAHLPLFVSPYGEIGGPTEELLQCIRSYQRLLILGEPGMGKTVALERTIWEHSTSANIVVPVFIPLIQYDGNLINTIIVALNEAGVLNFTKTAEVEQLILKYQCIFLFDGLNEVTGSYRDKLFAELASFLRAHPASPCIITSRSQDNLWRRFHSREMIEDAVVVRRITHEQISDYLLTHLGEKKGKELYDRLNETLRGLARVPLLLWLIKEAGVAGEELPGNRGELFDRFVTQVLKREQKQPALTTIPATQKMPALSRLAFHLQQEHRLACDYDEAVRVIRRSYQDIDSSRVIDESLQNGLIIGEDRLYFMHQAVQEYFTALEVKNLISSAHTPEKRAMLDLERYSLVNSLKQQFRKWAKDDWWSEVIVQLAGITDQPMFVVGQVLRTNPWLAYWCAIEGQPLSTELQSQIERQTVARLRSLKIEERLRVISELTRMENPRTISHMIVALGDASASVRELASETLTRLGEPSVNPLLDSLTTADERARWTITKTLSAIWRFPALAQLGADESNIRRLAAEALGTVGDDRVVLPLITALQDSDEGVRRDVAVALGKLGDLRAVDPLIKALKRSYAQARSYESSTISQALATLGKSTEGPLLIEFIDSKAEMASDKPETRREAIRKLSEVADERTIEVLAAALKDQDQSVRWEATRALGRVWGISVLVDLGDAKAQTRRIAAQNLKGWRDARIVQPLIAALRDQDSTVRELAIDTLGSLGDISISHLAALLSHKDREIRLGAGKALAKMDNVKVVEILA